jgi:hypothetical protein
MSTETLETKSSGGVKFLATLVIIAGLIMIVAGVATWFLVQDQLAAENITVADDADFLAGDDVNGPFSAYAQADIINQHALDATDGLTYSQLEMDDPLRETAVRASFLRASLFTSVLSFGVAAMAAGLGVVLVLIGWALRRLAHTHTTVATAPLAEPPPA